MGEVRPEYAALAAEFSRLAAPFGHALDETTTRDIARLASAIERIDRVVDEAHDDEERRALWSSVVARMEGNRTNADRIVAKEARTSEAMRRARTTRAFVPLVLREGRLTAALALVVAGAACGARFRRFFFRLGGPANLVDKIKDARDDHARGELSFPPGASFYVRLFASLVVRSAVLVVSHPRPASVVSLGLRYLRGVG